MQLKTTDPWEAVSSNDEMADLLETLAPALRTRARFMTQGSDVADDLTQDVLERALRWRGRFRPDTNLRAWLHQVLRNELVNLYRSRAVAAKVARETLSTSPDAQLARDPEDLREEESSPVARLGMEDIERALTKLKPRDADIFRRAYLEQLPYREIATLFAIPMSTVGTRLLRVRRKLRRLLSEDESPARGR